MQAKSLLWAVIFLFSIASFAETNALIEDIRLVPAYDGGAELIILYNGEAKFLVSYEEKNKYLLLNINGKQFLGKLTRKIEGGKENSVVRSITPYNVGGKGMNSKVLVQLKGKVTYSVANNGHEYRVFLRKKSRLKKVADRLNWRGRGKSHLSSSRDKVKMRSSVEQRSDLLVEQLIKTLETPEDSRIYKGEKVSIESDDVSVHDIFRLVGSVSGLNIITSSGVSGTVSLSLKDVPWDQLLDIVLEEHKLKAVSSGNVIRISTLKSFQEQQKTKLDLKSMAERVEPTVMAIIPVNFAKASEIQKSISSLISKSDQSSKASGFIRGKIEIDDRTNSLLVTDTVKQIKKIRALVNELDIATPQILIESKIVQATETFSHAIGVNWGGFLRNGFKGAGLAVNSFQSSEGDFSISNPSAETGSGLFGLRLGGGAMRYLDFIVNYAEATNQSKVIASPRVTVNNKKAANIVDGQKIAITTSTRTNDTVTVSRDYVDTSLKMGVTPQVTNGGFVLMDLNVSNDTLISADSGDIKTSSIQTQVLVESASTLVMGGIYTYSSGNIKSGLPGLQSLPILGALFRRKSKSEGRNELLIFITPRILEPSIVSGNGNEEELSEKATL